MRSVFRRSAWAYPIRGAALWPDQPGRGVRSVAGFLVRLAVCCGRDKPGPDWIPLGPDLFLNWGVCVTVRVLPWPVRFFCSRRFFTGGRCRSWPCLSTWRPGRIGPHPLGDLGHGSGAGLPPPIPAKHKKPPHKPSRKIPKKQKSALPMLQNICKRQQKGAMEYFVFKYPQNY